MASLTTETGVRVVTLTPPQVKGVHEVSREGFSNKRAVGCAPLHKWACRCCPLSMLLVATEELYANYPGTSNPYPPPCTHALTHSLTYLLTHSLTHPPHCARTHARTHVAA